MTKSTSHFSILWLLGGLLFLLSSCTTVSKKSFTRQQGRLIKKDILKNPVFQEEMVGFVLYDPSNDKILIDINGHKLFTPASNTKLLTFNAIYPILSPEDLIQNTQDTDAFYKALPLLYYRESEDTIFFWGAGNPNFLNPIFKQNDTLIQSFFKQDKTYIFCQTAYPSNPLGAGWMFEDAGYSFQRERSDLTIYGNAIHISKDSIGYKSLPIMPITVNKSLKRPQLIDHCGNLSISLNNSMNNNHYIIPFPVKTSYIQAFLEQYTGLDISTKVLPLPKQKSILMDLVPKDSTYMRILQNSDNFYTSQMAMMANMVERDTLSVEQFLAHHSISLGPHLRWADANGISRYNLISPYTMIQVLDSIQRTIPLAKIKHLFAAGGQSGTIKDWYGGFETPYIYAKTGTLSNNHNISGYIFSDTGRMLIFSFMNNHYIGSSSTRKVEMEKIFRMIKVGY